MLRSGVDHFLASHQPAVVHNFFTWCQNFGAQTNFFHLETSILERRQTSTLPLLILQLVNCTFGLPLVLAPGTLLLLGFFCMALLSAAGAHISNVFLEIFSDQKLGHIGLACNLNIRKCCIGSANTSSVIDRKLPVLLNSLIEKYRQFPTRSPFLPKLRCWT